jgi:VIT1/CCC1 family predicted Fe2+/Mn2+ transporter
MTKRGSIFFRLKQSLIASAGTIVFGMEDGTVSIFGLIFGVAATTTDSHAVLIAGAAGAVAAAVSMMAGVYLDAETSQDEKNARSINQPADFSINQNALLLNQLAAAGLTPELSTALAKSVQNNSDAVNGLSLLLKAPSSNPQSPGEQALWMLLADFLSAAVPILPFVFFPMVQARFVSAGVTTAMLILLGIGRARVANGNIIRTVIETVSIGIAAAVAGVAISLLISRFF